MKITLATISLSAVLALGLLIYGLSSTVSVLAQNGPYDPCGGLPPSACSPMPNPGGPTPLPPSWPR
jgi:hypothetical protein